MEQEKIRNVFADWLETQRAVFLPWCAVFFGIGIAFYFLPKNEPSVTAYPAACMIAAGLLAVSLLPKLRPYCLKPAILLAFMAAGFINAGHHARQIDATLLYKETPPLRLNGTVRHVEKLDKPRHWRILLDDIKAADEPNRERWLPERARIKLITDSEVRSGQHVRLTAKLSPPAPPAMPGAFDFQRYAFFNGFQASGFVFGALEILPQPDAKGAAMWLDRQRSSLAKTVGATLQGWPPRAAALASVLLTGQYNQLDEMSLEAMRDSGLAHMLSISGLHIGMVAGSVFFLLRLMLAAVPPIALRWPIKKIAAIAAFFAALAYLLFVGASVPAQRATIMTGLAMIAIVVDRSPLSLRLIAISALFVLAFAPESLFSASFQMSFAAVAALIVFYEWSAPHWQAWRRQAGFFRRALLYLGGIAMTSVVASLATAPFILYHFQNFSLYSVPANMLGVPLLGFIVMPAALLVYALWPLGLAGWPLKAMAFGSELILRVAETVSSWPHAVLTIAMPPPATVVLLAAGLILWFLSGPRAWPVMAVMLWGAVTLSWLHTSYDIVVSDSGRLAAIHQDGALSISDTRRERYEAEQLARMMNAKDVRPWPAEGQAGDLTCDPQACRLKRRGQKVSLVRSPQALAEECLQADAVIALFVTDRQCAVPVYLTRRDSWQSGAIGIRVNEDGIVIDTDRERRGDRPWVARR